MTTQVFDRIKGDKTLQLLYALLLLFAILKAWHLNVPLFHDELGVYGRAFFYMIDNGPQLLPGGMDHYISRGHPLFFSFFVSSVSLILGGSYIAARAVILVLSLALLLSTYSLAKEFTSKKWALITATCLSFQPLFFAQSTLILPEILLSLLGSLCLLFYLKKSYLMYFVTASLLVLTKETSVVIFAGIALFEWHKNQFKISFQLIQTIIKWSLPSVFFLAFLVIQKYQCGYFLYPYHTNLVSFSLGSLAIRLTLNMVILFLDQGRFILTFAALLVLYKMSTPQKKLFLKNNSLLIAVCLMMLLFSSINYFMPRYFLLVIPFYLIIVFNLIQKATYTPKHLLVYFLLSLPFQCNFFIFRNDDNMGYLIVVQNMQESIQELDRITEGKEALVFAQFPEINALDFVHNGYTNNPNYRLTTVYSDSVEYILKSGQEYIFMDKLINKVDYNLDPRIDSIVEDAMLSSSSKVELLYDKKHFFNRQRIFKTNN